MISKGVTCSKAHHFGYPAVTFRGCLPDVEKGPKNGFSAQRAKQCPNYSRPSTTFKLRRNSQVKFPVIPILVGGWTTHLKNMRKSKWLLFPQSSGWKKHVFETMTQNMWATKKTLQKSHALKILLDLFEPDFIRQGAIIPIEGGIIPYSKQFARLFVVRQCRHPAKRSYKWNKASSLNMSKHDIILTTNLGNWYTFKSINGKFHPKVMKVWFRSFPFPIGDEIMAAFWF